MKHSLYALVLMLLFHQHIFSQSFWAYTAGSIKEDEAMDICYDNSGNIISAGYIAGQTTFNTNPSIVLNSNSNGNPDIYVSKSNSSGQVIWAVKAGGSGSDRALSVKSDASGNIYITGFYYGAATFGSITLNSVSGSQDGFIAKLDANGTFLWAKSFGGTLAEWGNAIAIDDLGNPVITGQFQGTSNFSGTNLTSMINPNTSFSSFDVFIAKYSPLGNLIWINQGKAKYDDRGLDIITDLQNNIYVCGQFSDTVQFQNIHNNQIMNASFIIKYNSAGNEQWFRKASGVFSIPYSMVMDNNNKIYVTGDFQGTFTYFGASGNSFINGTYNNKAFLMKIDNAGNFVWGKSESSNNYVSSKRVALDAQQDPYIFGEFGCTMNEYSDAYGPGVFNSIGFGDLFITKYNNSGTRQWFKHYGGPRNDKAHGLLVAGINEPIMAGSYEHQLNIPSSYNSLISINNPWGYGSNNSSNQPTNYCSAPNNYSDYHLLYCYGYSDMFIYKGVDLTRNPYDYYNRSGTLCNLNYVGSCIEDRFGLLQCPDTIPICFKDSIMAYERANAVNDNYNGYDIGPIFRYQWNNNFNDTLRRLLVTSSGYNHVNVTTLDGCYSSKDTVYVKINPLPAPPTITDNLGINNQHLPWANDIHVCGPATITLTGGNIQGNSYQWYGNTLNTHDSTAIVNSSGWYDFVVTNGYSCKDTNRVLVLLDPPIPTFVPKQKNDTVTICIGQQKIHMICDTITNPNLNYTYPCVDHQGAYIVSHSPGLNISPVDYDCDLSFFVSANATGNYTYTAMYIIHNLCVFDTVYFSGHIYINVKPSPNATLNLNGNTLLCHGDSSLLIASIGNFSSPNITYTISSNDSIMATGGYYNVNAHLLDTISGCTNTIYDYIYVTVKPNPFIILSPYNSIICPNDSVKLTLNLPGALSYEWHGPSGLLPITTQSFYSSQAGFYHCIVTDTTGCVFTTNTVEIKQYATPYLISTPTNIICNNHPINLHVNTLDSTLIVWNAPLFGSGGTKVISNPGVYSCQVTMCGITTSLSINILGSNPTANITTFGSTTVCPFDSVLLTGNSGMTNYVWQPGNHLGQNYMVHTPGSYTLEVTDIYGCTAKSAPVTVAFSSTVTPPISITNDTICAGQTATLSATSLGGNQIDWFSNANSGTIINTGNTYSTPTLSIQTTYYVASVNPTGCHSFGVPATVLINPTSISPILLSDTTVCKHDSIVITTPYINGATYNWSGPGIGVNNTNHILIGNADSTHAGVYSLQISGNGCSSPTSTIHILVLNPIAPSISNNDSICENSNYSFIINPTTTNYTYNWQGPNSFVNTSDSLIISNASINQSGTYTVTSDLLGCMSTASTLQLTVLQTPATPTITNNSPVCVGDSVHLSVSSNTVYAYHWYGENGYTNFGNSISILATDTAQSGYYGVIALNGFCPSSTVFDSVIVMAYPSLLVTNDTIACDNSSIILSCLSTYGNYLWSNGSNSSSISVSQSGTYWVSSQNGNCIKTDSIHVSLIPCENFDVNVFTPNGDGANDIFLFKSKAIKEIHCEIRNRWGEKMFEYNGKENGWNGKNMNNNKDCEEGTYFYIAELTTIEGVSKKINGFITLIR